MNFKKTFNVIGKNIIVFILGGIIGIILSLSYVILILFPSLPSKAGLGIIVLAPVALIIYGFIGFILGGIIGFIIYRICSRKNVKTYKKKS